MASTIQGRFEVGGVLGASAQGTVFRARDRVRGDEVALKVWRGLDADRARDVCGEFGMLVELSHPAVVRVIDVGYDDALPGPFLVMELVEGEDLVTA